MAADCYDLAGPCHSQHLFDASVAAPEDSTSSNDCDRERDSHTIGLERTLLIKRAYSLQITLLTLVQHLCYMAITTHDFFFARYDFTLHPWRYLLSNIETGFASLRCVTRHYDNVRQRLPQTVSHYSTNMAIPCPGCLVAL